jgi:hypothetical protein
VTGSSSLDVALPFQATVAGISLSPAANVTPKVLVQSKDIFNGQLNVTSLNMDHFFDFSTFGPQELLAIMQSFSAFLGQYSTLVFYSAKNNL